MIDSFTGEYAFLSNFYPYLIWYDGMHYKSVEHAYQAAKTLNPEERQWVADAETPGEAKKRGRQVTMRIDWDEIKIFVMQELIAAKFNPVMTDTMVMRLLDTGTEELVEGNWWHDTFWGVCEGRGQNWLGKLLMARRNELRFLGEE